jgi:LysR family hydrogen peroxide-inducible transcriptional activator
MELHQIRYFLAVAETGRFSRAAARCGVAQPSLSQQIQKLERELGRPLFDRLSGGAVLTEAGHRLLTHARAMLAAADAARHEVRDARGEVAGRLSVGVIPTVAPYLLPPVIKRFLRDHRQVELDLHEHITDRLIEQLASGAIDLAIASLPLDHPLFHVEPLFSEPLLLVLPAGHRFADQQAIGWDDLTDERFLILHEMHCLTGQTLGFCRRRGTDLKVVMRGEQLATILHMVALGLGLSLVPQMVARADRSTRRVYRPLTDEEPQRTIVVAWHLNRYRANASRAFIEALRKSEKR